MGKFFLGFIGLILISIGVYFYFNNSQEYKFKLQEFLLPKGSINISSQEFSDGGPIPSRFTCDGADLSPALFVSNIPIGAKSLVLIMEDATLFPEPFAHWLSFNLSPDISIIESAKVLGNANSGINDFGNATYNGPCSPAGETHKYNFRVYALDTLLEIKNPRRGELLQAMRDHIIATGSISGVYSKNP
jgi:hypothetical protein